MKRFISFFIGIIVFFFLFSNNLVEAQNSVILEEPIATDIVYGEPLWGSKLEGGNTTISGKFVWKNKDIVLNAGLQEAEVLFIPNNGEYQNIEFKVNVNVNQRRIYLKFEKDLVKIFNEKRDIDLPNYVVRGIIDKDVYVNGKLTGVLENALVGDNKKVELSGLNIMGDSNSNYYIDYSGFTATVYPKYIEKFGVDKNRIDFIDEVYVPIDSQFHVEEKMSDDLKIEGYKIKKIYNLYVESNDSVIRLDGEVMIKIKINGEELEGRNVKLYNYYNEVYSEVEYEYKDGYLIYKSNGLGSLVIAEKEFNYWIWIIVFSFVLVGICAVVVIKCVKRKEKIIKYKSKKRRKVYGDY